MIPMFLKNTGQGWSCLRCFFIRRFRLWLSSKHTLPKWWCILVTASQHEVTDIKCNQLVKTVSARFLQLKVTIFPFIIINKFGGLYFKTMQISFCSLNFHPLVLAFIDYSCLNQLLLYWFFILIMLFFYYAIFYYALFLLCYFSWHSKEEVFLSHCLFILLYQYESMHFNKFWLYVSVENLIILSILV